MGDVTIGAAPAGQPGTSSGTMIGGQNQTAIGRNQTGMVGGNQTPLAGSDSNLAMGSDSLAPEKNQPQVNYVTSEQLNAAMERIERLVQSSTDKSYNRVQKMIEQMKQAGIQNPTADQARAMLAATGQSEQQGQDEPDAQPVKSAAASAEAEAWIKQNGGDVTKAFWNDIYDAAMESGVGIITREDPEYAQYFADENGQPKKFEKSRQFVRAFENAFEAKKQRLSQQGAVQGNLASSPAMGAGGSKSTYHDPKTTDRSDLITAGLRNEKRR